MDSEIQPRNQTTVISVHKAFISKPRKDRTSSLQFKEHAHFFFWHSQSYALFICCTTNCKPTLLQWHLTGYSLLKEKERERERIFGKKHPLHQENNFATCSEIIYLDMRPAQNQKLSFWCSACIWDVSHCRRIISREQLVSDSIIQANCSLALGSSLSHIQGWYCHYSDDCHHTVLLSLSSTSSNVAIASLPMCQCWHIRHTQSRQQQPTCPPFSIGSMVNQYEGRYD
jgi:hypothetical protein